MTFQPLVPLSGYAGWAFLTRTLQDQTEAFARAPLNRRDMDHFRETIGNVLTAGDLVQDYRLLRVALGAYGLQDDLPNKAFIRTVLEQGTSDPEALANRLADKRYRTFSEAFGFGEAALPKTLQTGFADKVLSRLAVVEDPERAGAGQPPVVLGSALSARDIDYFRETIGALPTTADFAADDRMLRIALSLYGHADDLAVRDRIREMVADGISDPKALAEGLGETDYRSFFEAFRGGSGSAPGNLRISFADDILARFQRQEFERAVGEQSEDMRLALTLQRELPEIAGRGYPNDTAWLTILGNPPLRWVFETALGLPESFGLADIDRQLDVFKERAGRLLGTEDLAEVAAGEGIDRVIRNFLARAQINSAASVASPASIALTLLQGGG